MLRVALLALIVANAGYFAWTHGWMATLGWAPEEQSEPFRWKQQVRPEVLSIVTQAPAATPAPPALTPATPQPAPPNAANAPATPPQEVPTPSPASAAETALTPVAVAPAAPTVCLQTENLDTAQAQRVQAALRQSALPAQSWQVVDTAISGRWMVYLGKFANEMALEKRRAELRARKIAYDRAGGSLELGLSLGRFSTEEAAHRELAHMTNQGVRGARVVQERAPQTLYSVRLAQVTPQQRQQLQSLGLLQGASALQACPANG